MKVSRRADFGESYLRRRDRRCEQTGLPKCNLRGRENRHQNRCMQFPLRLGIVVLCWLGALAMPAQQSPQKVASSPPQKPPSKKARVRKPPPSLSADERLSVIAAALDPKVRRSEHDCSHLVHAIYDKAGFPYDYAPSDDLYDGVSGFQRVSRPQIGDLVVWPGHVGIVIRPSKHVFYSYMTAGPGIDDYHAAYWVNRGQPRFYRYLKNVSCATCIAMRTKPAR